MKKVFTLLAVILGFTASQAQVAHQKDPYLKTFVQDVKRLPDLQLQAELRDQEAWKNFRQTHGDWWVEFNEQTGKPHRAYGKPIVAAGATPVDQARNFLATHVKGYDMQIENLVLSANNISSKYH